MAAALDQNYDGIIVGAGHHGLVLGSYLAKAGLDIAFDRYPYIAYATGLTNLFPVWSRDGGTAAFLARLTDSTVAPRIRAEDPEARANRRRAHVVAKTFWRV